MGVDNIHSPLHHGFISGTIGPGGAEGGSIVLAELIADIGKYRFIPAGPDDRRLQVVAKDGRYHTGVITQHGVNTGDKISRPLGSYCQTKNKTAKGQDGDEDLTIDPFTSG